MGRIRTSTTKTELESLQHRRVQPQDHTVVVLGASPNPTRYSYQALKMLQVHGYNVIPVHPKLDRIDRIPVVSSLCQIQDPVHTLTLYVGPARSKALIDEIVELVPGRVILNPGTESKDLEHALRDARIDFEHACTLVLLRTGQF